MINLYMIRHGACEGSGSYIGKGSSVHLTGEGRMHIHRVGQLLADQSIPVEMFLTSPQQRAIESAQIIGDRIGCSFTVLKGLEECDFGLWEGKDYHQISLNEKEILDYWIKDPIRNRPPGGETLLEVKERVLKALPSLNFFLKDEKEHNVFIVSHRGPIALLILHYMEMNLNKFWSFRIDRGSITKIALYRRFSQIVYLNFTAVP